MIRARFFVAGEPATQGSKRIVQPKGHRRPMLIEQTTKKLAPWRTAIEAEALIARQRFSGPLTEPLTVSTTFYFRRPKKPARPYPRHDLDKLMRAVGDGLVRGQLLTDDRQIVAWTASKRWTEDLTQVGCAVTVYGIADMRDVE